MMLAASPKHTRMSTEFITLRHRGPGVDPRNNAVMVDKTHTRPVLSDLCHPRVCSGLLVIKVNNGTAYVDPASARVYVSVHRVGAGGVEVDARIAVYLLWAFAATMNGVGGIMTGCGSGLRDIKWQGTTVDGWLTPQLRDVAASILGHTLASRVCAAAASGDFVAVADLAAPAAAVKAKWTAWFSASVADLDFRACLTSALSIAPAPLPAMLTDDVYAAEKCTGSHLVSQPLLVAHSPKGSPANMELLAAAVADPECKAAIAAAGRSITSRSRPSTNAHKALKRCLTEFCCRGVAWTSLQVNAPPPQVKDSWVGTTMDTGPHRPVMTIDLSTSAVNGHGLALINTAAVDALVPVVKRKRDDNDGCRIVCKVDVASNMPGHGAVPHKAINPTIWPTIKRSRNADKKLVVPVHHASDLSWAMLGKLTRVASTVELHGGAPLPDRVNMPQRLGPFQTFLTGGAAALGSAVTVEDMLDDATDAGLTAADAEWVAAARGRRDAGGALVVSDVNRPELFAPVVVEAIRQVELDRNQAEE
jgi:hypothetical protein